MKRLQVIGAPTDFGAGRRGVDMGASAIRLAGLRDRLKSLRLFYNDCGNVDVTVSEQLLSEHYEALLQAKDDQQRAETELLDPRRSLYLPTIEHVCRQLFDWGSSLSPDDLALILGGDHSISIGSVAGLAQHGRTGVIWVDAHADINTPETSPSGNIHGMPVAHLLGLGGHQSLLDLWGGEPILQPSDIVYIGLRDVDEGEKHFLAELGIRAFTIKDVDLLGMAKVTEITLEHLQHTERIHVSFDMDVLDPSIAPGVGTPVPGGLSYREAHLLMELLCDAGVVNSLDLVEANPILDIQNQTAILAVELASSLLGESIL